MDVNTIRIVVTLIALCAYVAIVVWAYTPLRKERLDAQARSILDEADA
jgi:cbb3-type cytochrome oxidase subunit 3